jgi:carbonic anhydrase/acetyltransferase-like protein (isoleucine patch superfamily)
VQPSLRAVRLAGITPLIYGSFVAPTAAVIGKVRIGSNSSIWYAAVIRGNEELFVMLHAMFDL